MAEAWAIDGVREEIRRATSVGGPVSRSEIQEILGIGAGDLDAALTQLHEGGEIVQAGADLFAPSGAAPPTAPPEPTGAPPETPLPGTPKPPPGAPEPEPAQVAEPQVREAAPPPTDDAWRETVLSRAMVKSLEDAALGALVRAGVEGEPGTFLLRVEP